MRKKARKQVRKLRHWKQRWNKSAEFIWRRPTVYAGKECQPGDLIPDDLKGKPTKLRRFWESHRIELAEFEAPDAATGQATRADEGPPAEDLPEGVTVARGKGSWFVVATPDGETRVNGRKALDGLLDELRADDWL